MRNRQYGGGALRNNNRKEDFKTADVCWRILLVVYDKCYFVTVYMLIPTVTWIYMWIIFFNDRTSVSNRLLYCCLWKKPSLQKKHLPAQNTRRKHLLLLLLFLSISESKAFPSFPRTKNLGPNLLWLKWHSIYLCL